MAPHKAKALLRYGELKLPGEIEEEVKEEANWTKKTQSLIIRTLKTYTPVSIGSMPLEDVDDDPTIKCGFALWLSGFYVAAFCTAFVYVYMTGIADLMSARFLSLDPDPTSVCKEVPKGIDNTFQASVDGYWQTNASFRYNNSLFELQMTDTNTNKLNFSYSIMNFSAQVSALGEKGKTRSLLWTQLALMTFEFNDTANNEMFFSNAEPQYVFDQHLVYATMSSINGICQPAAIMNQDFSWSANAAQMTLTMPLHKDTNISSVAEPCPGQGKWLQNVFSNVPASEVDMTFDLDTTSLAFALNMNITSFTGLITVESPYVDKDLGLEGWQDPYYSGLMDPAFCMKTELWGDVKWVRNFMKTRPLITLTAEQLTLNPKGPPVCFVPENFDTARMTLFYPYMNQYKHTDGGTRKQSCVCPDDAENPDCNQQDFYVGLIYSISALDSYNNHDPTHNDLVGDGQMLQLALKMQNFMVKDPINGDMQATLFLEKIVALSIDAANVKNKAFYTSSLPSSYKWAQGKSYNELVNQEWTNTGCKTCGAVVFNSFGSYESRLVFPVNQYGLQLASVRNLPPTILITSLDKKFNFSVPQVMCKDALSNTHNFQLLANSTPGALVENYLECSKSLHQAAMQSLGNSLASAQGFLGTAWLLLGMLVVYFRRNRLDGFSKRGEGLLDKEEKKEKEKERKKAKEEEGGGCCGKSQKDTKPKIPETDVERYMDVFKKYDESKEIRGDVTADVLNKELNDVKTHGHGHDPKKPPGKVKLTEAQKKALKLYKNFKGNLVNDENIEAIEPAVIKLQNQSLIKVVVALSKEVFDLKKQVFKSKGQLKEDEQHEFADIMHEYLEPDRDELDEDKKKEFDAKAEKDFTSLFEALETFVIRHEEDSNIRMSDSNAKTVHAARRILRRKHEYKKFGKAVVKELTKLKKVELLLDSDDEKGSDGHSKQGKQGKKSSSSSIGGGDVELATHYPSRSFAGVDNPLQRSSITARGPVLEVANANDYCATNNYANGYYDGGRPSLPGGGERGSEHDGYGYSNPHLQQPARPPYEPMYSQHQLDRPSLSSVGSVSPRPSNPAFDPRPSLEARPSAYSPEASKYYGGAQSGAGSVIYPPPLPSTPPQAPHGFPQGRSPSPTAFPRKSQDGQTSAEEVQARFEALVEQRERVVQAAVRRSLGGLP